MRTLCGLTVLLAVLVLNCSGSSDPAAKGDAPSSGGRSAALTAGGSTTTRANPTATGAGGIHVMSSGGISSLPNTVSEAAGGVAESLTSATPSKSGGAASGGSNSPMTSGGARTSPTLVASGGAATSSNPVGGAANAGAGGVGSTDVGSVADTPWVTGNCPSSTNTLNFESGEFCVSLTKSSQTVAALKPKAAANFDFVPADLVASRATAGYFHLGDLTLRYRTGNSGEWQNVSTSQSRAQVTTLPIAGNLKASADLAPAFPSSLPLTVTRSWSAESGRLYLRFDIKNRSDSTVQLGALGVPMVFNNVITNRTLEQAHASCSFADPYIGTDAGYLQVTRLNGGGPALLVLPEKHTAFEAYNPILNAPKPNSKDPVAIFTELTPRSQTFEGFWEWMIHSQAYADTEWAKAKPWNPATSLTLEAGEAKTYGFAFVLSDTIRDIEKTLIRYKRPVAVGIPGYVLPMELEGKLYLNYPATVASVSVEPANALELSNLPTTGDWKSYQVKGKLWGRSRLSVTYADGTQHAIHYYVTKAASQAVTDLGKFLTTKSWFVDANDPFGRSPSVMTYDHESSKIVTQTKQAWVCGLGDEGGATWLAGAMKLFGQPDASQVSKYQDYIDGVLWGNLQYKDGANAYGIKRTLFYYEPKLLASGYYDTSVEWVDPTTGGTYWGAWNKAHTLEVPRSYNYPHVAALYWTMYRLARNHVGLVTNHPWDWYLNQAYKTAVAMTTIGSEYAKFGLMDGTVFVEILRDLKREALSTQASDLESKMKARESVWRSESFPFGSEMAWDSTGQEEVYAWTRYFGDVAKSKICIDAITGYMPTLPHWGYNGCARRYWDFVYGGAKIDRLERMLHHYGSSLNAIPLLTEYRDHPDDLYLLRIGYAGAMASLSNIDQDGFPSMAYHAFPDTLKWDPVTGDYGPNFFGHAYNAATYLVKHPNYGWVSFGGNVTVSEPKVVVTPMDAFRMRFYLAPVGLYLTLDAGRFQSIEYDAATKHLRITLDAADANTSSARLRIEQPALVSGVGTYTADESLTREREAVVIPLSSSATSIELAPN